MSDPIAFDSSSPRFALPLLFAGQAQKEVFVNEALARADALMHCAIEGISATPPSSPVNGEAWLVGASPTGDWAGQAGMIACRQAGNWLFVTPRDGMRLLDKATGQDRRFNGSWQVPARPAAPSGGTTVDAEARSAISNILNALAVAGILPPA
jgi:hypothetical protein